MNRPVRVYPRAVPPPFDGRAERLPAPPASHDEVRPHEPVSRGVSPALSSPVSPSPSPSPSPAAGQGGANPRFEGHGSEEPDEPERLPPPSRSPRLPFPLPASPPLPTGGGAGERGAGQDEAGRRPRSGFRPRAGSSPDTVTALDGSSLLLVTPGARETRARWDAQGEAWERASWPIAPAHSSPLPSPSELLALRRSARPSDPFPVFPPGAEEAGAALREARARRATLAFAFGTLGWAAFARLLLWPKGALLDHLIICAVGLGALLACGSFYAAWKDAQGLRRELESERCRRNDEMRRLFTQSLRHLGLGLVLIGPLVPLPIKVAPSASDVLDVAGREPSRRPLQPQHVVIRL